jgi:ABC-type oligopeptide transport system ATPase subunit
MKSQNLVVPSATSNRRAAEKTHIPERFENTEKSGTPPVLQVRGVDKVFEGDRGKKVWALKQVSFSLYKGECLGIVGESGSGKSTLARVVSHLTGVNRGTIHLQDKNITTMRGAALKRYYQRVQMIFQDPLGAFSPRMKIGEYMVEPFLNFGIMSKKRALTYARELLERVELSPNMVTRYPSELSGGQLQRVVIARCVGLKPEIIICDECTSALDVTIQQQIINLFQKLRDDSGFSSLFITHDLALAETICDRILVMYKGEVVERLTGDNIVCEAAHPYTVELISSVFCLPDYVHHCCKKKQFRKHSGFCTKGQCLRRNERDMMLNECSMH